MNAKVIPWSYSSLTGFENCAFQYYSVRIAQTTPRQTYKEADEGVKKHAAIEAYLKKEQSLDDISLRKLVDRTLAVYNNTDYYKYEHKLAITKDRQPCGWDDPECYHRGILDVLYVDPNNSTAAIFDWKNGKVNHYTEQLKANSITVFAHYPHIETVHTEYVWMKHGVTTVGKNFRDFSDTIWEKFVARADRLESALANEVWPKKKSGLCKNYCPVHTCEHNGKFTK